MKSILVSSRRVLTLSLVASALAFAPTSAKATTIPAPINAPNAIDAGTEIGLVLAAYGL